jgi:hypothetical protein
VRLCSNAVTVALPPLNLDSVTSDHLPSFAKLDFTVNTNVAIANQCRTLTAAVDHALFRGF